MVCYFSIRCKRLLLNYNDNFLNIDYNNICEFIDSRIEKVYDYNNMTYLSSCKQIHLNTFFSFCLSLFISSFYFSIVRTSHIDALILKTFEKANNNAGIYIKIKQIINIVILICLIDPLLKNYLTEAQIISDMNYYLVLLPCLIIVESFLGLVCLKYQSLVYLEQNIFEIMEYNPKHANSNPNYYLTMKTKIIYVNDKFWILISEFIYFNMLPYMLYLFFINRSGASSHLHRVFFGDSYAPMNKTATTIKNATYSDTMNDLLGEFNTTLGHILYNDTVDFYGTDINNATYFNNTLNNLNRTITYSNYDSFVFKTHFMEVTVYFFIIALAFCKSVISVIYQFVQKTRQDTQRLIL